jgi:folate-dependent phosphoribosylglycinamide formyltransferase PurN
MSALRIGLLGMDDNAATEEFIRTLGLAGVELDVVFLSRPGWRANLRRAVRKVRSAGLSTATGRAVYALKKRFEPRSLTAQVVGEGPQPRRVHHVGSFNEDQTREIIRSEKTDLLLSATDEILRRTTFSIPRLGTLNAHPGWLPQYRGLGSEIRMLRDGYLPAVSVHFVDEGIDTGPVLLRRTVEGFEPVAMECIIRRAQAVAFAEVVRMIRNGAAKPIDTFLEHSSLGRGVPFRIVRQVTKCVFAEPSRLQPLN